MINIGWSFFLYIKIVNQSLDTPSMGNAHLVDDMLRANSDAPIRRSTTENHSCQFFLLSIVLLYGGKDGM